MNAPVESLTDIFDDLFASALENTDLDENTRQRLVAAQRLVTTSLPAVLASAEDFVAGFEDDITQPDVTELLDGIRDARSMLSAKEARGHG